MDGKEIVMKQATREWLKNLIVTKKNSKAIEIRDYIAHLESELERAASEDPTLQSMDSAPKDGTEILAYHIEGGNFHPIVWKDYKWEEGNIPGWGMRWNEAYSTHDVQYKGWKPYPKEGR